MTIGMPCKSSRICCPISRPITWKIHRMLPRTRSASTPMTSMNDVVPADPKAPLNMYDVINRIVDRDRFLGGAPRLCRQHHCGVCPSGRCCRGHHRQPTHVKAGTLDIDASDKGARFIRFCNAFNVPILTLVDVPGFLPGVAQEQGGIIRHGAKMLFAYSAATVPKITLITRKAYGGSYLAMCSRDLKADMVFAWPTAEIAVMGAEGAVNVLYRKELAAAEKDREAMREKYVNEYRDRFASPYMAASHGMITDVISPAQTRAVVSLALRNTMKKSETRPPKKHGLIPL